MTATSLVRARQRLLCAEKQLSRNADDQSRHHLPARPLRPRPRRREERDRARPRRRRRWRIVPRVPPVRSADVRQRPAEAGDLRHGAGFWPARGEERRGRLCAFLRRVDPGADPRGRCGRRGACRLLRIVRGRARPHQRPPLWRRQPARCAGLRSQGEAARRDRRLCARQGPARAAGLGQPRGDLAGGRDRPPRRRDLSRHPPAGARQRVGGGGLRRPAGNRQPRLWRTRRLSALHRDQGLAQRGRRRAAAGDRQSRIPCPRPPAKWTWCSAPAGPA